MKRNSNRTIVLLKDLYLWWTWITGRGFHLEHSRELPIRLDTPASIPSYDWSHFHWKFFSAHAVLIRRVNVVSKPESISENQCNIAFVSQQTRPCVSEELLGCADDVDLANNSMRLAYKKGRVRLPVIRLRSHSLAPGLASGWAHRAKVFSVSGCTAPVKKSGEWRTRCSSIRYVNNLSITEKPSELKA